MTDPANICYLTGYDGSSYYVAQAVILSTTDEHPVLVMRAQDVAGAVWTTHLPPRDLIGYDETYVFGDRNAMSLVGETIRERGWAGGTVGAESDASCLRPSGLSALRSSLTGTEIIDGTGIVNWIRSVKSPAELDAMRMAGRIGDRAMAVAFDRIDVGVRDCDVAAAVLAALIEGIDGACGSRPLVPIIAAGARSNAPHLSWTGEPCRLGEPVAIELGGHRHNYATGLSRTVFLGEPSSEYVDLATVVQGGLDAAIGVLRTGSTAHEVHGAWHDYTSTRGYEKDARIGYALGLSFAPTTWIEDTVSIAAGQQMPLQDAMTIHLMVAMWLADIGYWLSESFIVGPGEPESLSRLPRDLVVK